MGRESASYVLALSAQDLQELLALLDAAGSERGRTDTRSPGGSQGTGGERSDYRLRDPHRYWIDLRVDHGAQPRLEIRIALTNDAWSIRGPLERALTPLPPGLVGERVRDGDGNDVAVAGAEGWWLQVEEDYGRRRDEFVARVGDYTAPLSADHVYMYLHQTRWNEDNDDELSWHREREIAQMQEMWEEDDAPAEEAPP